MRPRLSPTEDELLAAMAPASSELLAAQGVLPATGDVGHRLALDLRLGRKTGLVELELRQRYTATWSEGATHTLRTRLGAELRLEKVRPYVYLEPFFRVSDTPGIHKVRLGAGVKLPTKGPDLRLFTHFEQQTDGDRLLVAGIGAVSGAKLEPKRQESP